MKAETEAICLGDELIKFAVMRVASGDEIVLSTKIGNALADTHCINDRLSALPNGLSLT